MQVIKSAAEMRQAISPEKATGKKIGFVPTMGALHEGHLELVKKSLEQNDLTVASIFVNPLQFNNVTDLQAYPRALDEDLEMLRQTGLFATFCPEIADMYTDQPRVSIDFGHMETVLEGKYRPGHFNGVGIVVSKLFNIIQPDHAYFGLKDLQQFLLVQKMANDLSFPVQVIGVETYRSSSGLALSSRNRRLSNHGLEIAANIYKGLQMAKQKIAEGQPIQRTLDSVLEFYNSTSGLSVEYFEIVKADDLMSVENTSPKSDLAVCVAAYVEGVRLIDNLYLHLH